MAGAAAITADCRRGTTQGAERVATGAAVLRLAVAGCLDGPGHYRKMGYRPAVNDCFEAMSQGWSVVADDPEETHAAPD